MVPFWNLLFCSWSLSALLCLLVPPPPTDLIFLKTPRQSYKQAEHLKSCAGEGTQAPLLIKLRL